MEGGGAKPTTNARELVGGAGAEKSESGGERKGLDAVTDEDDRFRHVRYSFIRDRPHIAAQQIAVRAELNMRLVMPAIVPHSEAAPFLGVERFECGPGGNPHHHGFIVGVGNPRLGIMPEEIASEEIATEEIAAGRIWGDCCWRDHHLEECY